MPESRQSVNETEKGSLRTMTRPYGSADCMNAWETSRAFSRRALLDDRERMKCKPSMLGVGLEIPHLRAETPTLLMSLATILTRTLVSLLYAETHLLGITRIPGFFFYASPSACHLSSTTLLQIGNLFFHSFKA